MTTTARQKPGRPPSKYEALAETLETRVRAMSAHDALPTERELLQEFSVSRTTVRRALQDLLRKGLVYNIQGSGTYVADPSVVAKTLRLTGFSEDMKQRGLVPTSRILQHRTVAAAGAIVAELEVTVGEPLIALSRLRLADNVPMALEDIYLVAARIAPVHLHPNQSLYTQLAAAGIVVDRAAQRISAVNLDAHQARHLDQAVGAAALEVSRVTFTDHGQPFERAVTTYRGDRYSFEVAVGVNL